MHELKLTHSPLHEMSISLEIARPAGLDEISIASFLNEKFGDTAEKRLLRRSSVTIGGKEGAVARDTGFGGGLAILKEKNAQVGFLVDRLVYTQKQPYSNWDDVVKGLRYYWKMYSSAFKISKVEKVSVQCVNFLDLNDLGTCQFGDVISLVPPELSDLGSGVCVGFHYEETLYYKQPDVFVSIDRFYRMRPDVERKDIRKLNPIRMDIRVFKDLVNFPDVPDVPDDVLVSLRKAKNAAFENALTEAQLARYR